MDAWRDINAQKPANKQRVLICEDDRRLHLAEFRVADGEVPDRFCGSWRFWFCGPETSGGFPQPYATHWQPLPELPPTRQEGEL